MLGCWCSSGYDDGDRADPEIKYYVRREMDDASTCGPCPDGDGTKWERLADIAWMPGIDCKGGKRFREDLVAIYKGYWQQRRVFLR
jgi:hypothetical protein